MSSSAVETTPLVRRSSSRKNASDQQNHSHQHTTSLTVSVEVPEADVSAFLRDLGGATYSSAVSKLDDIDDNAPGDYDDRPFTLLFRHDSVFSVGSDYKDAEHLDADADDDDVRSVVTALLKPPPLLTAWQGAILLTADCLGTGLLALPGDVRVLGYFIGLSFLIINGPINLYAGTILAHAATTVERRQEAANRVFQTALRTHAHNTWGAKSTTVVDTPLSNTPTSYTDTAKSIQSVITIEQNLWVDGDNDDDDALDNDDEQPNDNNNNINNKTTASAPPEFAHTQLHHDTATFDFVGMTQALFKKPAWTRFIMSLYYTNIFLVLGNYILVMSHAVVAAFGEGSICIPIAGVVASAGMFFVIQSRTMARLGRAASILSLLALLIVVVQCLYATNYMQDDEFQQQQQPMHVSNGDNQRALIQDQNQNDITNMRNDDIGQLKHHERNLVGETSDVLRQLASLGSVGFAMGSQKLFLNIRHELQDRSEAPKTLAMSLALYTTVYLIIVLLSGPNPPDFLFDSIKGYWNRRVAGFLLWAHVIVSYAINSQAICSSIDRLFLHRLLPHVSWWHDIPAIRWLILTFCMTIAAYTLANAIPFFQDLVSLIGSATTVPLTLLMPAIFWRKQLQVPIWIPTRDSLASYALLIFSLVFMITATVGVLDSIKNDWKNNTGKPFECVM